MQHDNVLSLKGLYIGENEDGLENMRLLGINEHIEGLIDADSLMRSGKSPLPPEGQHVASAPISLA
jgi:hypothetical protein